MAQGKSNDVHSLTLSSHRFLCLSPLLAPLTVHCKMDFAMIERYTRTYHFSLFLFTIVRRSLWCLVACWILLLTSTLLTWFKHEIHRIFQCDVWGKKGNKLLLALSSHRELTRHKNQDKHSSRCVLVICDVR